MTFGAASDLLCHSIYPKEEEFISKEKSWGEAQTTYYVCTSINSTKITYFFPWDKELAQMECINYPRPQVLPPHIRQGQAGRSTGH